MHFENEFPVEVMGSTALGGQGAAKFDWGRYYRAFRRTGNVRPGRGEADWGGGGGGCGGCLSIGLGRGGGWLRTVWQG